MNDESKKNNYIENVINLKLENDKFHNLIRLFSHYLSVSNKNYKYNETYLENFCDEFIDFKEYIALKNAAFTSLVKVIPKCSTNIILQVDEFWEYNNFKSEILVSEKINKEFICDDFVNIKILVIKDDKQYPFYKKVRILKSKLVLKLELQQLTNNLREVLKYYIKLGEEEKI